jgi:hypothetical protein
MTVNLIWNGNGDHFFDFPGFPCGFPFDLEAFLASDSSTFLPLPSSLAFFGLAPFSFSGFEISLPDDFSFFSF